MQKVASILPSWDKTKTTSKKGFDKTFAWADKLGAPVNRLSNKIGSEAFWPTSLDKESDKAARILKSFCKDGFYAEEDRLVAADTPRGKQRVLKKIPQKVIQNAVGLAIFTTMRSGLWISGAGGSGILVARKEDGTWSPPSGILLHTAGLGFLIGVDIYDCVVVINNRKALDSFTKIRATLGGEISAVAGPVGVGGVLENDGKWKQVNRPVFTYLKSRGFYAGVQVDGTVIIERTDENERFYGQRIGVADILAGKIRHPPYEIKMLMETLKSAEGSGELNARMEQQLEELPAPGDIDLQSPTTAGGPIFGIPEPDDPDPFGVLALEKEGFEIREAGSKSRPSSTQFEYNPSPTSPIYSKFHRRSMDTLASRTNRESFMSNKTRTSTDRATQTEMGTQTDESTSRGSSPTDDSRKIVEEPAEVDYTKIDLGPYSHLNHSQDFDGTTVNGSPHDQDEGNQTLDDDYISGDDDEEEEPIIFEAAKAQATVVTPQTIMARGGLVNIPKRTPPPLPPRNSARISMDSRRSGRSPLASPSKSEFEEVELHGSRRGSGEHAEPNAIIMEDLEQPKPVRVEPGLDTKVEHALEEEHLEKIESTISESPVEKKIEELLHKEEQEIKASTEEKSTKEEVEKKENREHVASDAELVRSLPGSFE